MKIQVPYSYIVIGTIKIKMMEAKNFEPWIG